MTDVGRHEVQRSWLLRYEIPVTARSADVASNPFGAQLAAPRDASAANSQSCSDMMEKSGELLLLGAPRTAGVHFCCPVWPEPRFRPYNLGR